jgi:hypothetical protein
LGIERQDQSGNDQNIRGVIEKWKHCTYLPLT